MSDVVYKIDVDVSNAPSGNERLAQQQGQPTVTTIDERQAPTPTKDKLEEAKTVGAFSHMKAITGGVTVVGAAGISIYKQNATFKGDSNTVEQVGQLQKYVGYGTFAFGAAMMGNPLLAAGALGMLAFNLAKENREIINTRENDSYQSNYYQERLIYDISQRSR